MVHKAWQCSHTKCSSPLLPLQCCVTSHPKLDGLEHVFYSHVTVASGLADLGWLSGFTLSCMLAQFVSNP